MKPKCQFEKQGKFLVCAVCGARVGYVAGVVNRICGKPERPKELGYGEPSTRIEEERGFGTLLKNALSFFGITQERVEEWLGSCKCKERQRKLDYLSKWAVKVLKRQATVEDLLSRFKEIEREEAEEKGIIAKQEDPPCEEAKGATVNKWAYGITTVPERIDTVFPKTLESLRLAGFDQPRLFVDGENDCGRYAKFDLDVTLRYPRVKTAANWVLSMVELYLREPNADRYAIFQDDFITYRNLRQYLDALGYPDEKAYCNLYTFPQNQQLAPAGHKGWFESNQRGKGAVALVFSNAALLALLHQTHLIERPKSVRGDRAIDGGIVSAMTKAGYREYCHSPSLVQHTGLVSSMGNPKHPLAPAFEGEGFDAMRLLDHATTRR